MTQLESEVEPDSIGIDIGRESVSFVIIYPLILTISGSLLVITISSNLCNPYPLACNPEFACPGNTNKQEVNAMPSYLSFTSRMSAWLAASIALTSPQLQAQEEGTLALEEVVVVAQRREQSAMVVPLTVNVFNAEDITETGALTLQNIDGYIPGFDAVGETFTQQRLEIRGVSSPAISSGSDPSVATFYDEAYLPRAATTIAFSDMAQIEILKGPQGTLFGRNAAAGVINIIPNSPSDTLEAFGRMRLGNDGRVRVEGMANTPVTDTFFLRFNALTNQVDGFVDQEGSAKYDGGKQDHNTTRIAGLWEITDSTRAQLSYDWDKLKNAPSMSIGYSEWAYSTDPFDGESCKRCYRRRRVT